MSDDDGCDDDDTDTDTDAWTLCVHRRKPTRLPDDGTRPKNEVKEVTHE